MAEIEATETGDLTSTETKKEINCGEKKYWDLLNSGELEAYYVGRTIRVTRESIEAYKKRNRYTPRKELKGERGAMMHERKRRGAA